MKVSAAALTLDTTTSTQTTLVAGSELQTLPLNGRDFTQLISVSPGFGGYSAGGFGTLNGTRANQVNWQIDGVTTVICGTTYRSKAGRGVGYCRHSLGVSADATGDWNGGARYEAWRGVQHATGFEDYFLT